jgi:hypothetical protein
MPRKLTHAEYQAQLDAMGRGFVALEQYVDSDTSIEHQCPESEDHKWPVTPHSIKCNKSGCPHCAGKIKQTTEQYAEWLKQDGRGFVALEPYVRGHTPILHQCPKGHQWRPSPTSIKRGSGCSHCAGKIKQTTEQYAEWLKQDGRGFVALEPYVNNKTDILHRCPEGHKWFANPDNIKNRGSGCPHCSGRISQDYNEWLELDGRGYVTLEPYVNARKNILHQCPEGHQWPVAPDNIKSGTGCPDCCKITSDANVFYIWENVDDTGVYKVGISSKRCAEKRIAECTGKNKMKANIILIAAVSDAKDIERKALEIGKTVDYPPTMDGYTEFRRYTDQELGEVYRMAVTAD